MHTWLVHCMHFMWCYLWLNAEVGVAAGCNSHTVLLPPDKAEAGSLQWAWAANECNEGCCCCWSFAAVLLVLAGEQPPVTSNSSSPG